MIINTEGVKSVFQTGTLVCSTQGLELELYMKRKHGWSMQEYKEYLEVYKQTFVGETNVITH